MNTTTIITLAAIVLTFTTFKTVAQNVNIPDANFKAYLVGNSSINTNLDSEIQTSEAAIFSGGIYVAGYPITNLTGIEAFTALTSLNCSNNLFANLDFSSNTALTSLDCSNNSLTNLDVSTNTNLISLVCQANFLTNLDVSSNINLTFLSCSSNQLTNLNIRNGNNTNFYGFSATNNTSLTCIQVDNAVYMNTNWPSAKDALASYNEYCTVGVNEDTNTVVSIYPNPTNGRLNIILGTTNELVNYTVLTIEGKIVVEGQTTENTIKIDLQNNSNGIYFLKINGKNTNKTIKVIKE